MSLPVGQKHQRFVSGFSVYPPQSILQHECSVKGMWIWMAASE